MSVSLYACGTAEIEVGKYGMTLPEAKEAFLAKAKEHGLVPTNVNETETGVSFSFRPKKGDKWKWGELHDLLGDVASIADLHGDPPDTYILKDEEVPQGQYVRTGTYND